MLAAHCRRQHLARLLARYRLPCVRPECRATTMRHGKSPSNSSATSRRSAINKPMDRLLAYQRYLGPQGRIVDVGGQQTHRTLDTLATLPGKTPEMARQAVIQRQAGRGAAIMRDAEKALGTKGAQYLQTLDELEKAAIANSKPFYDQIRDVSLPVSGGLREVLQSAKISGRRGMNMRQRLAYPVDCARH